MSKIDTDRVYPDKRLQRAVIVNDWEVMIGENDGEDDDDNIDFSMDAQKRRYKEQLAYHRKFLR